MRFIFILVLWLIASDVVRADEPLSISYHDIEFVIPNGYQRTPAEVLERISYTSRYGEVCSYDIGISKVESLDDSYPQILILFYPEKNNYFPACKKDEVDLSQILSLPENVLIFDKQKGVICTKVVGEEVKAPRVVGMAAPAKEGFVYFYFFFDEVSTPEVGVLMESLVKGLNLKDYEFSFSFYNKRRIRILCFVGFFMSGVLSVFLFKRRIGGEKSGRGQPEN